MQKWHIAVSYSYDFVVNCGIAKVLDQHFLVGFLVKLITAWAEPQK